MNYILEKSHSWTSDDFEILTKCLLLLRVNCAKYLFECRSYLKSDQVIHDKFSTLGSVFGIADGYSITSSKISWDKVN